MLAASGAAVAAPLAFGEAATASPAPTTYAQQEIPQLLIDWAQAKGQINPADFFVRNWQLVREGVPLEL